jgi:pterin-4a-carbinolamine dehydratase
MPRLDDTAVEEGLQHLPGWERRGDEIVKTFVQEDFAQAMGFVNQVATPTSISAGTRSPWPCPATPRVA